ncbi:NAD-dependent succinate-semialdehyde dehydrogenase [Pigmentiphaga kullae]|uniref:Succinate-semialdehyde dehydrogenase/glutarate-semialdehyde dehydrogenase n=1 Tax=Pigmentiphaga kullae TaxID=151784 RepID=A0A4Q7N7D4_9BURK|nr:NAD-dependent succinate-semialdehyde dehydrogenase [Pigmentiphaga kullae]RZS77955.1 succinate-semialdehyde dehydrogenase/glutarate-semialdehyde dehydrogenase [Pigmentiphaga kullae]
MKREQFGLYQEYGLYIDGEWLAARDLAAREVFDPATEEIIGFVPVATPADLDAALASARDGLARWRQESPWARSAALRRAADLIRAREDAIARLMARETGKPLAEARGETQAAADQFEWYAEETKRIYGQTIEGRTPDVRMTVRFEPVGVVAAFSAWNFPALLPARKLAAALAAGCSVVIKPASEAPGSCMALVQACHDAGVARGAVNLVTGDSGLISRHLIESPLVRKVSLTGSVDVGRRLLGHAAAGIKKVSMELGGHAPALVFEDADPIAAATALARAKFRNCGQVCISPSRFFVHEAIYPAFCDAFAGVARSLRPGSAADSDMGPLANARGLAHARSLVDDAVARGARLLTGGRRPATLPRGYFFEPTVLADVPADAAIMNEEPFVPVAPLAPFSRFEDAIARANALPFGLAGYVFSNALGTATRAAEALECGMVGINEVLLACAEAPFGGIKESGMGREGGSLGIHDYLQPKLIRTRI